ncbi:biotin--[acetyl-CoA-carboxylase] ligase [Hymenobacter persicinus]|uniref:biotin--[biotin carboxyl-carrier protein] ligase n=1 Tax=Hymenobacter persicinus TaxID=2025506 RepID=A0A4Q5LAL1_9BACT|nr:biotin--[acetyl-CoA-carboxylase] ligase [Hymenobacter persicinus]RYU77946.1 biotin--[acetyl-CoA-carboxylase] ligase [Hymenobacter persicinus]
MEALTPQTLFTGQQIIWLPECASTNAEAQALIVKNSATDGCTVITDKQTAGRGQRGNRWEATPGENLTLSVIWKPSFLAATEQFQLSQAVALGVLDWARSLLGPDAALRLKWPNDIFYGSQKLGGILIENTLSGAKIQYSVIGIGLNVNQREFGMPTATSLAWITGRAYPLRPQAVRLLECLERRYLQLRAGRLSQLRYDYLQSLYRYQQRHEYEVDGERVTGQIVGVDETGRLAVEINGQLRTFGLQEIRYIHSFEYFFPVRGNLCPTASECCILLVL